VKRFLFQAEDGIRDRNVTGVQTCALPILEKSKSVQATIRASTIHARSSKYLFDASGDRLRMRMPRMVACTDFDFSRDGTRAAARSEERRVGRECGDRGRGAEGRRGPTGSA